LTRRAALRYAAPLCWAPVTARCTQSSIGAPRAREAHVSSGNSVTSASRNPVVAEAILQRSGMRGLAMQSSRRSVERVVLSGPVTDPGARREREDDSMYMGDGVERGATIPALGVNAAMVTLLRNFHNRQRPGSAHRAMADSRPTIPTGVPYGETVWYLFSTRGSAAKVGEASSLATLRLATDPQSNPAPLINQRPPSPFGNSSLPRRVNPDGEWRGPGTFSRQAGRR
jgi:hypothetical protein